MRIRLTTVLLAASLGLGAPAATGALEYSGRLGMAYERSETWSGPEYSLVPRLRLAGSLEAQEWWIGPGVIDWTGRIGYDETRTQYATANEKYNGLTYGSMLGFLNNSSSLAKLRLTASRSRSDYSLDSDAIRTTGSAVSDAYSVSGGVGVPGLPGLRSQFAYGDTLSAGLGRPETRTTTKDFALGMQSGQAGLDTNVDYRLQWGSGTLDPVNYTLQRVGLTSVLKPSEHVFAGISGSYFLRDPSVLGPSNPRLEHTIVNAVVGWSEQSSSRAWGQYTYQHATTTNTSLQVQEHMADTVSANFSQRTSPEWEWVESAAVSFGWNRAAAAQSSSGTSQTLGLTANWNKPAGGASLGVRAGGFEGEGASPAFAYGANASGHASWQRPTRTFGLSYAATYEANVDAAPGWSTTQSVSADVRGGALGSVAWAASVLGSGSRSGGPLGASAQRSLSVQSSFTHERGTLLLAAGVSDAVTGSLSNPISDGLFIPAGFNTHSRYASASASVPIREQLSARASAKFAILSGPGTPDQREALLGAGLYYGIGYWTLTLDESYTTGGTSSFDHRVNLLFVRLSRSFGGR
ncbi:MAG TPA: hypothetical protein VF912_02700 [Anaeromyxobacter sp.]